MKRYPSRIDPATGEVIERPGWTHYFPYRAPKPQPAQKPEGRLAIVDWEPGKRADDTRWNRYHRDVFGSKAYRLLGRAERDLLMYLFTKYQRKNDGSHNNGRLSATLKELEKNWAWGTSPSTLAKAIQNLLDAGFIERSRDATQRYCALYALTWLPKGKAG